MRQRDRRAERLGLGLKRAVRSLLALIFLPAFLVAALLPARRTTLVWGSSPLISNKYWSEAMKAAGHDSLTIMAGVYRINRRGDFDRYFEDFAPRWLPQPARLGLGLCFALLFVLRRARVMHMSYNGFALGHTWLWRLEARLFRMAGIQTILMPYGADAFIYSRVIDMSVRHGLLAHYPEQGRLETDITKRVDHWNKHADVVLAGLMVDGQGRWDVPMNQIFVIDTAQWEPKVDYSPNDGRNGPVRVLHTPNHRTFKGTEFLIDAVERLRAEGLQVELVLLEGVPNDEVKRQMRSADILAEQFLIGYAFSGIEGMASGLPVMSNLESEAHTRIFRRFSFLNECPVVSSGPETLADNLRALVLDPELRETLGRASRAFAEKYHSYRTAQYLFGSIYENMFHGGEHDLMQLFHPLLSDYNRQGRITHPLVESRLPQLRHDAR